MKKILIAVSIFILSQMQVLAGSCPLSSDERWLDYKDGYYGHLRCGYSNGWLSSRSYIYTGSGRTAYEIITEYYSNGMLKRYTYRGSNMGGGLYIESRSYNPSGMLIEKDVVNGQAGYSCNYAGNYRLRCDDYSGSYYESVEYASQYEGN